MTYFKPQKIPSVIYKPLMADLNILIFIRIHRETYFIGKLQEAISTQFQDAMKMSGKTEKCLSIIKLIAAGLINFTVPVNTELVVGEEDRYGYKFTGFVDSDNLEDVRTP